jgi:hypothetical protein
MGSLKMIFQVIIFYCNNHYNSDIEKSQVVSKINVFRFALCVESEGIVRNPISLTKSYESLNMKDPKKLSQTGQLTASTAPTQGSAKKSG